MGCTEQLVSWFQLLLGKYYPTSYVDCSWFSLQVCPSARGSLCLCMLSLHKIWIIYLAPLKSVFVTIYKSSLPVGPCGGMNEHILTPGRSLIAQQRSDPRQVWLVEPTVYWGYLTGGWVTQRQFHHQKVFYSLGDDRSWNLPPWSSVQHTGNSTGQFLAPANAFIALGRVHTLLQPCPHVSNLSLWCFLWHALTYYDIFKYYQWAHCMYVCMG